MLAVGGGIAAYKSAFLCSRLVQSGHDVRVVLTKSALKFVGVSTFSSLSGQAVATDVFQPEQFPLGAHIELAKVCDLMIVAPATANVMARFASGMADDLISTLYLQVASPVLLAPAMSDSMWQKSAVRRNVACLREDGCHFVGPSSGFHSI